MEVAAYATAAMTLGLVVARPRVANGIRINPAVAGFIGVAVMAALGIIGPAEVVEASSDLFRPLVAIAAIMVMTDVAHRVGLLDWWALQVEASATTTAQLFTRVYFLGVITASVLNNDAAILLLTPMVVALVRRRFPERPAMAVPFAFAVFTSAGVAALPVSNPMNMVVAEVAGIGFNQYAAHMAPVAAAGWVVAFFMLRLVFRSQLAVELASAGDQRLRAATGVQWRMMVLLGLVLLSYPIVGYFGGPVWGVATAGALMAVVLTARDVDDNAVQVVRRGVSWETLAFLLAVVLMSLGLREVGLVARLVELYAGSGPETVGAASALGSAVLNNHPMAYLNTMALRGAETGTVGVYAALVGGDLGPRLLPMGSLAGLMWLELLRRGGIHISIRRFFFVGAAVTIPSLVVSLAILACY